MLLSFRFANHRSFRDEQQLNLTPVYETDDAADDPSTRPAVPVAGIFGANASGKSNVISALRYMSSMVGTSDRESEPGRGPRRQPFLLDPEVAAKPSSYAADLMLNGIRHTYGFVLDDDRITDEWLYTYPLRRKRVIFERNGQDFDWGEESRRSSIRTLVDIVAPTALFLSVAARFEPRDEPEEDRNATSEALHNVFSWLWQRTSYDQGSDSYRSRSVYLRRWLASPSVRRAEVIDLLRAADVGLRDISVKKITLPPINDDEAPVFTNEISFIHQGAVDNATFRLAEESSGTLRLLELASRVILVLERGGLFVVDEIDASLHPLLTGSLIRLFQSPSANRYGGQLIFTSHDATLLGSIDGDDVLERDQVWFTSKDEDGASELFPLSEFKPRRQGENRQKRYLNGSYGAIPELSMQLFERAVTSRMDSGAE